MKQPELGRKIAELRKQKGLTQEELITQCKLSIRTLQRIESGDVMPRNYTIKSIFAALDYEAFDVSMPSETQETLSEAYNNDPGQFLKYVINLFNLKTNIMKKLLILSSITICLVFIFSTFSHAQSATNSPIQGKWQLCDASGKISTAGHARIKLITFPSFSVSDVDLDNGALVGIFMGSYTLKGDVYTETIEYTAEKLTTFQRKSNTFKVEIKGDLMYVKGVGNGFNEVWKKIK